MSNVNPLPFLAQGTLTCFTPQSLHSVRGTRQSAMDIGFELKEVQVVPGSLDSIMHTALCFAALRARKFAACFKIHVDIELSFFNTKIH
jgi:hypothetical protein